MSFSDYLETKVLNDNFVNQTVYVALFTTAPTEAGGGAEVSGGGYTRKQITFGAPTDVGDGSTQITNSADVLFPIAADSWGTVTHYGIFDAEAGGNLLDIAEITDISGNPAPRNVEQNDQMFIPAGGYTIKLD